MIIALFILSHIALFGLGMLCAFLVVGAVLKVDSDRGEGVWLTYHKGADEWRCFGNLATVYSKARTHRKPIKRVC